MDASSYYPQEFAGVHLHNSSDLTRDGDLAVIMGGPNSWDMTAYRVKRVKRGEYRVLHHVRFPHGSRVVSSIGDMKRLINQKW